MNLECVLRAPIQRSSVENAERFRVRLLRNTRANNFSVAILTFISRSDGGGGRAPGRTNTKIQHLQSAHINVQAPGYLEHPTLI